MSNKIRILPLFVLLMGVLFLLPACSNKSGCPAQESLKPKVNRKGEIVASRKSHQEGLFPKKMKKRMK
jgi:hypothetical protein